jgi:hypothetical protein
LEVPYLDKKKPRKRLYPVLVSFEQVAKPIALLGAGARISADD